MSLPFTDWTDVFSHLLHLGIAYALALPIGWEREKAERSAGIRTFPLVAVASCGFVLIALEILGNAPPGHARILSGLITGIGFIGGGAILKEGRTVRGTATAASIWTTGVVGASAGYGYYDIALVLSIMTFLTLRLLLPLKQELDTENRTDQRPQEPIPPSERADN